MLTSNDSRRPAETVAAVDSVNTTAECFKQDIDRIRGGYVQAVCSCSWRGVPRTIRQIYGWDIALRDTREHASAHAHGRGWFDYLKGWVANPAYSAPVAR